MNRLRRLIPAPALLSLLVLSAACAPPAVEDVAGDIDPIPDGGNPFDEVAPSGLEPLFELPTRDTLFNPLPESTPDTTAESTADLDDDPLFNTAVEATPEATIEATPEATAEATAGPGQLFGDESG